MFNSDLDRAEQPEAETIAERLLQHISESTESTIQEIVRYVEQVVSGTGDYGKHSGGESEERFPLIVALWKRFGKTARISEHEKAPDILVCSWIRCPRYNEEGFSALAAVL